ncbi:MAG TPA: hypothetical protein VHY22_07015 [Chthoniobacteraceae bacterium]|nr:hypothetical protein [Chthoniobacteraceae bacterium]
MRTRAVPAFLQGAAVMIFTSAAAHAQLTAAQPESSPTPAIRDIRPPVDVFPYPMWMVLTVAGIALVILAVIVTVIVRMIRKRMHSAPPPTPRERALQLLREAEADIVRKDPYAFSIQVSDILRHYVTLEFNVHATEQTSPEFLAAAARSPHFTGADKHLLADFLDRCDLIKFARVSATIDDSKALLEQAVRFVNGAAEPVPAAVS